MTVATFNKSDVKSLITYSFLSLNVTCPILSVCTKLSNDMCCSQVVSGWILNVDL